MEGTILYLSTNEAYRENDPGAVDLLFDTIVRELANGTLAINQNPNPIYIRTEHSNGLCECCRN